MRDTLSIYNSLWNIHTYMTNICEQHITTRSLSIYATMKIIYTYMYTIKRRMVLLWPALLYIYIFIIIINDTCNISISIHNIIKRSVRGETAEQCCCCCVWYKIEGARRSHKCERPSIGLKQQDRVRPPCSIDACACATTT